MKYCSHCGGALEEGSRFCNHCGAPVSEFTASGAAAVQAAPVPEAPVMPDPVWEPEPAPQPAPEAGQGTSGSYSAYGGSQGTGSSSYSSTSGEPATDLKRINVLCYIPFFFFLPLFLKKTDPFSRFHINQGAALTLLFIVSRMILGHGLLAVAVFLFELYCVVFGAKNVAAGKMVRLPVIGKLQLIKK